MRATLSNPDHEADLDRHGFAVVPFADDALLDALRAVHRELGAAPDDPQVALHFGFHSKSREYKQAMADRIRPLVEDRIAAFFDDHEIYLPIFITKWPGPDSGFGPHQDPTLVDERRYRGVSLWLPLVETGVIDGRDNGMLHVIPGSHRFNDVLRTRDVDDSLLSGLEEDIMRGHGVGIPTQLGEAIIFDDRLIHYSMPNATEVPRVCVLLGMRPAEASSVMVRREPDDTFAMYEIPDSSYIDVVASVVELWDPATEPLCRVPATSEPLSADQFAELCRTIEPAPHTVPAQVGTDEPLATKVIPRAFCAFCGTTEDLETSDRTGKSKAQFQCRSCRLEIEAGADWARAEPAGGPHR